MGLPNKYEEHVCFKRSSAKVLLPTKRHFMVLSVALSVDVYERTCGGCVHVAISFDASHKYAEASILLEHEKTINLASWFFVLRKRSAINRAYQGSHRLRPLFTRNWIARRLSSLLAHLRPWCWKWSDIWPFTINRSTRQVRKMISLNVRLEFNLFRREIALVNLAKVKM